MGSALDELDETYRFFNHPVEFANAPTHTEHVHNRSFCSCVRWMRTR